MLDLSDAGVIVTGASSGIGAQVARDLAARGAHVFLTARRRDALDEVAADCSRRGGRATVFVADLLDTDSATHVGTEALRTLGVPRVLVNAAGAPRRIRATRLTITDVQEAVRLNYVGAMAVTLAVLPEMLDAACGDIVNIGSMAGRIPPPREGAYAASKHALAAMTEALRADLEGTGVRVHLVTPAVIDTPLWDVPGQEPGPFRGQRVPARAVSDAVVRLLETDGFEAYVPRRFRVAAILHALLGERFIRSAARYDRRRVPEAYD